MPESVDPEARKGIDLIGAALAFLGLGLLVYGLIAASDRGWSNSIVVCSLLAGAALLVGFVVAEARGRAPMMPLEVFRPLPSAGSTSSRCGGLADRFGARIPLIVGPVIVGIGFFLLALPGTGGSYWATFLLPFLVLGFGMCPACPNRVGKSLTQSLRIHLWKRTDGYC